MTDSLADPLIYIVDDDDSVRRSLSLLLSSAGFHPVSFQDAVQFMEEACPLVPGCIILDIFLEGLSGLDLQAAISEKFRTLPVIYISGQGDIDMSVKALKGGALDFLQKPVDADRLFAAVQEALERSHELLKRELESSRILSQYNLLTAREKEVLFWITRGLLNKQIAAELNIREQTVKIHRGNITRKLGIKSVAELVRFSEKISSRV